MKINEPEELASELTENSKVEEYLADPKKAEAMATTVGERYSEVMKMLGPAYHEISEMYPVPDDPNYVL